MSRLAIAALIALAAACGGKQKVEDPGVEDAAAEEGPETLENPAWSELPPGSEAPAE